MSDYSSYLLWDVIFPNHLRLSPGAKIVEIGSAPGEFLVRFSRKYQCIPYGVEYSQTGVEVNRATFVRHGFDPQNVIHTDFFDDGFRERYLGQFDIVCSRGFIEHFADPQPVIDRHIDLLKPGGYLLVDIPNLRGLNKPLAWFFDKGAIPRHNLDIMRTEQFRKLFNRADLEQIVFGHYGVFSFYLFTGDDSKLSRYALKACHRIQPLLNLCFRSALGNRRAESRAFSPFLQYIGRKAECAS
jgi:SAM-dependent methyltransferase